MGNLSKGILAAMRADIKTFGLAELKLKTWLLNGAVDSRSVVCARTVFWLVCARTLSFGLYMQPLGTCTLHVPAS